VELADDDDVEPAEEAQAYDEPNHLELEEGGTYLVSSFEPDELLDAGREPDGTVFVSEG